MGPMERLKVSEEGITITKPMNIVSLVESEQKKKMSMQRNPGWRAIEKAKFYIGITVPNLKKEKKKKGIKREKEKKKKKIKPVQLAQKWAVSKVYRYTIKVYRYTLRKIGQ